MKSKSKSNQARYLDKKVTQIKNAQRNGNSN